MAYLINRSGRGSGDRGKLQRAYSHRTVGIGRIIYLGP